MTRLARPFAALFALWFAIVLGDPGMLHTCPMHSAHSAAPAATHEHSEHAHAGATQDVASSDQSQQADDAPCTCIGHCCAVSAAAPVTAAEVLIASVAAVPLVTRPELPSGDVPSSPDVRLPFANGPPRA